MDQCKKVKNPCRICLGPVTTRNGIKCTGGCQNWLHFTCLNYTPGKIKDVKSGIIIVSCPCPNCKAHVPKEYRTDEPFSCSRTECEANNPPSCSNLYCPSNEGNVALNESCPLAKCGLGCKINSITQLPPCTNQPAIQTSSPYKECSNKCTSIKKVIPDCSSGFGTTGYGKNLDFRSSVESMSGTLAEMNSALETLSKQMKRLIDKEESKCDDICMNEANNPNYPDKCT